MAATTKKAPAAPKAAPTAKAAAAPAAAKAGAVTTATWKQVTETIAEKHELPKVQAKAILDGVIEELVGHLKAGERVRINGLGILQVKKREARMGRNPQTGQQIQIAASKKVTLTVAKELKDAV